jgi:lipid A 3-O-deacylase
MVTTVKTRMSKFPFLALPVALLLANAPVHAVDGIGIDLGEGPESTEMVRMHAIWDWDKKWFEEGNWHVSGYWEATLGRWNGGGQGATKPWDIGFTPVFRLQRNDQKAGVYLEGGVGVHLLSEDRTNKGRIFGSHFSFGDHIGVGILFGKRAQYDFGYRIQHLSNAGLKKPNDGITFEQIRFTYSF